MSPHRGADGLVQGELPPTSPEFLTVFTSLACYPGASPYCHRYTAGCWAGIGEDCRPRTTWRPLTLFGQPGSPSFATHWRYCHADETVPRQDVNSPFSLLRVPPRRRKGVCTHARSGPSRVRRRLLWTCLGDPIPLAIHCIASVGNCEQVHTSVLNLIFQQAKVAGVGNLSKWRSEICSRCWSAP